MNPLVAAIFPLIETLVNKVVPDKGKAAELTAQLQNAVLNLSMEELKASTTVLVAEITGEGWLQRSWRPLTMLTFVGLIVLYWMGFTQPNLPVETVGQLLEIVKVGLGGYVIGRSAEKVMKEYKS